MAAVAKRIAVAGSPIALARSRRPEQQGGIGGRRRALELPARHPQHLAVAVDGADRLGQRRRDHHRLRPAHLQADQLAEQGMREADGIVAVDGDEPGLLGHG